MSPGRRGRITPLVAIAVALVVLVVVVWWFLRDDPTETSNTEPPSGPTEPAALGVLSITGAPQGLIAVLGADGPQGAAALVLPPGTTFVAPGQGETTTEEAQALPGAGMRIAVSNAVGVWAGVYGVTDVQGVGDAVDRAGGLSITLPDPVTVGAAVEGPGEVTLSGAQVESFLLQAGDELTLRWMLVLEGLLGGEILQPDDLLETDDAERFVALLDEASGAAPELAPVQVVGGTTAILAQPELDDLMGDLFATPVPTPVVVENGSGDPGAGELVGARIIPEGFRIVLSGNAESFRYDVTQITATGQEHVDDAETIREALGTGEVQVTQVPSGLADVVIVTGKDLET